MSRFGQLFLGLILLSAAAAGVVLYYSYCDACPLPVGRMGMGRGMWGMGGMMHGMRGEMRRNMDKIERKTEFSSPGEKIFYRGIGSKGDFISNSHGMQGVGCAMCHGADAHGMRMMMMDMPALTWKYLTDPEGHIHPDGRRHPPFTEESLKSSILAGIDPAGNPLNTMMPGWQMSAEDLDSLIEYLKTK